MHDLEAIKRQHPLTEIMEREHGQPERVGRNLFWLCPFHDDKSPSLLVDRDENFYCFGCEAHGDLFDYLRMYHRLDIPAAVEYLGGGMLLSPEDQLAQSIERAKRQQERLEAEIAASEDALAQLQSARAWEQYHLNLLGNELVQKIWDEAGLPFAWQIGYGLGYAPSFWGGESLTIPVYTPFDADPINIRHRVLNPGDRGKYLPERSGLPSSFYWARPKLGVTSKMFVVEGEKKAMVLYRYLSEAEFENVQVIGIMGAKGLVKDELAAQVESADLLFYIPDPDVDKDKIWRTIKTLNRPARLITLPGKVDDMLVSGILDGRGIVGLTHSGVSVG